MSFETAVELTLQYEGGYVPPGTLDPGGETNFGISKHSYPNLDIKNLTRDDAIAIYKKDFWDKMNFDQLPEDISGLVFDAAVNQGPHVATLILQRAAGVTDDGIIGPVTLAAVRAKGIQHLRRDYTAYRLLAYASTTNFQVYGKGWFVRAVDICQNG
jgi:lysozyme family protein